jgi:iron complex outermembrane receptor protein
VRGGGAVLYGAGATGGTINIITKRGQPDTRHAYALARAGGYGTGEARAGYATMGDAVGFSIDASHEDTKGYRRDNHFRDDNVAGTLEARGSSGRAYVRVAAADQRLELPGALTEAQILADPRQASTPGNRSDRQDASIMVGGSLNVGRHELAADLSYRNKNGNALFLPAFFIDNSIHFWSFSPRAKLRFDALGREHDVVIGMDVDRWDYDNRDAASPDTLTAPFSHRVADQENRALYAQANLWPAARTRLVLGGRVQHTDERINELVFPDDRRESHDLRAYDAAARQLFGGGWSAYAKYGSSFRVATFDENACFFPPCALTLLEPQTAHTAEIGSEYERSGLRARAGLYDTRLHDEIFFSPTLGTNVNLPPTERRGLELEGAWRASPAIEWRASLATLEAKFRDTGKDVPLVPRYIATAGVAWSFAARTRLNVNTRYVGSQRYDNDPDNVFRPMPAYGLLDAKLEHAVGRGVSVALEGRNLLDKNYYSYGLWDGANSFFAYPQPRRAVYLSVAWRT